MLADIYSDENQEALVKIASETPQALELLSHIGDIDLEDKDELSSEAFAWPEEKMFPIYTKEAALVSSIYLEQADVPEYVKTACEEACMAFGIEVSIGSLEKIASEDVSLEVSDFVLPGRKKLPVVDSESYASSESVFLSNLEDLSFSEIVVGARQLIKKASEYEMNPDDSLSRLSLSGNLNVERAIEISKQRYSSTADDGYLSISEKLAGVKYGSIEKIAEWAVAIDSLDDDNNLNDPLSIFQAIDSETKSSAILFGNEEVEIEKIAAIDSSDWLEIASVDTVEYLFSDGELDIDKLASMVQDSSPEEYDIIDSFVKNKTRI